MGEVLLIFAGLALAGYLLVAPLVVFVFAVRADRRNEELLSRVRELEGRVAALSDAPERGADALPRERARLTR